MTNYPHPLIAREGWPFLTMAIVLAALVTWYSLWWSIPFWIVAVFVLQFFRDPARDVPQGPGLVLVPADGRVIKVEWARDPYRNCDAMLVSVFMNVFNVHSNRSPVDGIVEKIVYNPGRFVNADLDKASTENERNAVLLKTTDGKEITAVQVAGLIARRILCYTKAGEHLQRGQRFGFIRFGSRVDIYLPLDVRIRVSIGDKVSAGSQILAEWN